MKQLFLIFAFLIGYSLTASAEKIKLVPSAGDSTRMDTVVISELSDADAYAPTDTHSNTNFSFFGDNMSNDMGGIIVLISVIMIFGRRCSSSLSHYGSDIRINKPNTSWQPKHSLQGTAFRRNFFNERNRNNEIMTKGITHIFLGIGLGVFLWVMTGVKGLAAIGFLIFCMGIGQVLIAYTTTPRKQKKDGSSPTRMSGDGHEDTPHNEQ